MKARQLIDKSAPARITESPERIRLGNIVAEFDHPSAIAFCVIGDSVVYSGMRTHPWLFNAVNDNWDKATLAENDIHFKPALTPKDRAWFEENYTGDMGELREITRSGRAWKNLRVEGKKVSACSFWSLAKETPVVFVSKVIDALGLVKTADVCFVEYIDSKKPVLWGGQGQTERLKSKKYPNLSQKQIIGILVKAHTEPHNLSKMEKDVADEFRGKGVMAPKIAKGFFSAAEQTFFTKIGDSLKTLAWADRLLDKP